MTVITIEDLKRNFASILDDLEKRREEVLVMRGDRPLFRITPEARGMTVEEAFKDIYGILTEEEGEAWLKDAEGADRPLDEEMEDPWE